MVHPLLNKDPGSVPVNTCEWNNFGINNGRSIVQLACFLKVNTFSVPGLDCSRFQRSQVNLCIQMIMCREVCAGSENTDVFTLDFCKLFQTFNSTNYGLIPSWINTVESTKLL